MSADRILELREKLDRELFKIAPGSSWEEFSETRKEDRKILGRHISVYVIERRKPIRLLEKEISKIFEAYFATIKKSILSRKTIRFSTKPESPSFREIVLVL